MRKSIRSVPLPMDLIKRILLWLPPKSLVKFMSVSKYWYTLIRSAFFARQYLIHSRRRPPHLVIVALHTEGRHRLDFYTCDLGGSRSKTSDFLFRVTLEAQKSLQVPLQHCNGLVLINTTHHLHVCNPSTRDFVTLPEGSDDEDMYDCVAGLGFVPGDNAYKVARYVYEGSGHQGNLQVHTIGRDSSWRLIEEDPPYPICMKSPLMPAAESIYFRIDEAAGSLSLKAFLRFSLGEEKFHVVHSPPISDLTGCGNMSIVDLDGAPCLVHRSRDRRMFDMWIARHCGSNHEWVHRFCVGLEQPARDVLPLAVRDGRILVSIRDRSNPLGRLQYYDPESLSFEPVVDVDGSLADLQEGHDVCVACCVESLGC